MEYWLYAELQLAGIFILSLIMRKMKTRPGWHTMEGLFAWVLIGGELMFGVDLLWAAIAFGKLQVSVWLNYLTNLLYLCAGGFMGYQWMLFTEFNVRPQSTLTTQKRLWFGVPLMLLTVLSVLSIWTGWLFTIDSQNVYQRGSLFFLSVVLGYGYVAAAGIWALVCALKERNEFQREKLYTLASFSVLPMLCSVIQILSGVPAATMGITISLLMVFVNFQDREISRDGLTQLNNRNQLYRYLSGKISGGVRRGRLFLMIMDVNDFKKINDTFGHVEGDKALIRVADALRQSCGDKSCFVARYGGDEFIAVLECAEEAEAAALEAEIKAALAATAVPEYLLTLSIGRAELTEQTSVIQHLIAAADAALYRQKAALKRNRS